MILGNAQKFCKANFIFFSRLSRIIKFNAKKNDEVVSTFNSVVQYFKIPASMINDVPTRKRNMLSRFKECEVRDSRKALGIN